MSLTKEQVEFLKDRSLSNPSINIGAALAHNAWLGSFLRDKPLEEHRFRPLKGLPGDDEYVARFGSNVIVCRKNGSHWEANILLPYALLSPSGKAGNSRAAVHEFTLLSDRVMTGEVHPSVNIALPADLMEEIAALVHEDWRQRESYRRGKDPEFDRLDIPYAELAALFDGELQMEQDRQRARTMWDQIRKDFPA